MFCDCVFLGIAVNRYTSNIDKLSMSCLIAVDVTLIIPQLT